MTDDQLSELEECIDDACREKVAQGWQIRAGVTLLPDIKCCCPLGAIGAPGPRELRVKPGFIYDFTAAFDRGVERKSQGGAMGARFRARWLAGEYEAGAE